MAGEDDTAVLDHDPSTCDCGGTCDACASTAAAPPRLFDLGGTTIAFDRIRETLSAHALTVDGDTPDAAVIDAAAADLLAAATAVAAEETPVEPAEPVTPGDGDGDASLPDPDGGEPDEALAATPAPPIDPNNPGRFTAILVVEEEPTPDGRIIAKGATTWRQPPLPLMLMTTTAPGHDGAVIAGVIEKIRRSGNQVLAEGRFDTSDDGVEAARLVRDGVLTGISIDGGDVEYDIEIIQNEDGEDSGVQYRITAILVLGATACPFQAIGGAQIQYVTASAETSALQIVGRITWEADDPETFGVSGATGLPLSDQGDSWDATAAEGTVRKWASSDGSGDLDKVTWSKYARAFFWVDPNNREAVGGYKLGFAEVRDGTLTAVWRGVTASAGAVQGARGGVNIPDADVAGVKARIGGYYRAAAKKYDDKSISVPWADADVETLTAAGPRIFPRGYFDDPALAGPTTVRCAPADDDGNVRIYGHALIWGTCHVGLPGCTLAPHSKADYAYFKTGTAHTDAGAIAVGTISLSAGHATRQLSPQATVAHYDNTALAAAYVNVGEDEYGVWVAGVLAPGLSEERATEFACAALSGDWRRIGGNLEMVALLAVNHPGYPVIGMRDDEQVSLVAAGYGPQAATRESIQRQVDDVDVRSQERYNALEQQINDLRAALTRHDEMLRPIVRERLAVRVRALIPPAVVPPADTDVASDDVAAADVG